MKNIFKHPVKNSSADDSRVEVNWSQVTEELSLCPNPKSIDMKALGERLEQFALGELPLDDVLLNKGLTSSFVIISH